MISNYPSTNLEVLQKNPSLVSVNFNKRKRYLLVLGGSLVTTIALCHLPLLNLFSKKSNTSFILDNKTLFPSIVPQNENLINHNGILIAGALLGIALGILIYKNSKARPCILKPELTSPSPVVIPILGTPETPSLAPLPSEPLLDAADRELIEKHLKNNLVTETAAFIRNRKGDPLATSINCPSEDALIGGKKDFQKEVELFLEPLWIDPQKKPAIAPTISMGGQCAGVSMEIADLLAASRGKGNISTRIKTAMKGMEKGASRRAVVMQSASTAIDTIKDRSNMIKPEASSLLSLAGLLSFKVEGTTREIMGFKAEALARSSGHSTHSYTPINHRSFSYTTTNSTVSVNVDDDDVLDYGIFGPDSRCYYLRAKIDGKFDHATLLIKEEGELFFIDPDRAGAVRLEPHTARDTIKEIFKFTSTITALGSKSLAPDDILSYTPPPYNFRMVQLIREPSLTSN